MKSILGFALVGIAALIIGCGGGGGGGGTTGGGTTGGKLTSLAVTGFTTGSTMLDPRDLVPGDTIQLDITGYDSKGNRVTVPVSGWRTNAPNSVARLTGGGLLTAVGASSASYTIEVIYAGTAYSLGLRVTAAQSFVTGLVRNLTYPINNVGVDFFNSSGGQVGVAYTSADGTFRASVPSSAVRFTIDMSLADPDFFYYYNEFAYNSAVYLELDTCHAKLPSPLSASSTTALPSPIVPQEKAGGLPPPPPTGCVG